MFIKVVLKNSTPAFDKKYTYSVQEELAGEVYPGSCVEVPFGRGNTPEKAFVMELIQENDTGFFIKSINKLYKPSPMLIPEQIDLAEKMVKKYSCTYGDTIRLMIPPDTDAGKKSTATAYLSDPDEAAAMVSEGGLNNLNQLHIVEYLLENGESLQNDIMTSCQISKSTLQTLRKKGVLEFGKSSFFEKEEESSNFCLNTPFALNEQQKDAIEKINSAKKNELNEFLLFGITGSGKTEVYLNVIQKKLEEDKGCILLVPEISLTHQMTARLRSRFGDNVRILHSRLTPKERNLRWKDILEGKAKVVAGARSAIFAPVKHLDLIIIDEEQETSYKSEAHPKYCAADIARMRLEGSGGVLLEGSATPKVETYYKTQIGSSTLLSLPKRIGQAVLPDVSVVDMRQELSSGNRSIISMKLKSILENAFENNEKAMLFINRRGHSGFYLCRDCGYVPKCTDCSISLTYHSYNKSLICHYCGKIYRIPKICPVCKSKRIGGFGAGTQQVEEVCAEMFPDRKILRMDKDTTTGRGSHEKILKEFETEADILIGTQMIAKGHDFPLVTAVGIISADLMLGISDFRASERTFQLITQAAGRAGRADRRGNVVIQAYNVDDYAIRYASEQDYPGFYKQEIIFRESTGYPPFGSIGVVIVSSSDEQEAYSHTKRLRNELNACALYDCRTDGADDEHPEVMEFTKAPIYKIRNRYRYRIVIKTKTPEELSLFFNRVNSMPVKSNVYVSFDTDPYQML